MYSCTRVLALICAAIAVFYYKLDFGRIRAVMVLMGVEIEEEDEVCIPL